MSWWEALLGNRWLWTAVIASTSAQLIKVFLILLLTGRVVARVLLQVALLAALVDFGGDHRAIVNELLQFGLELGLHLGSDVLLLGFSHKGLNLP